MRVKSRKGENASEERETNLARNEFKTAETKRDKRRNKPPCFAEIIPSFNPQCRGRSCPDYAECERTAQKEADAAFSGLFEAMAEFADGMSTFEKELEAELSGKVAEWDKKIRESTEGKWISPRDLPQKNGVCEVCGQPIRNHDQRDIDACMAEYLSRR